MEFRRFVSYLYHYVEDEKERNCGFVRVEIRQNLARFVIHMYLPQKIATEYHVFGFVRKEGMLEGILLGSGKIKNGNVDIRLQMQASAVGMGNEGQQVPVTQLAGIVVGGSDKSLYATVWDDGEIKPSTFKIRKEKSIAQEEVLSEEEVGKKQDPEKEIGERVLSKEETGKKQDPEKEIGEGEISEEEVGKKQDPKKEIGEEKISKKEVGKKQDPEKEIGEGKVSMKEAREEVLSEEVSKEEECSKNEEEKLRVQEMMEQNDGVDWNGLRENCPPIMPFEREYGEQYVRIEPKDLKYLPRKLWHLGRNSFLLHGYYNYRYLILGQSQDNKLNERTSDAECARRTILGVPGMYSFREAQIAVMFGFGEFRTAHRQQLTNGCFGYWCCYYE